MCGNPLEALFGGSAKQYKPPKVEAPAPPAPERKQDTGAIVAVGNDDNAEERRRKAASVKAKGGSSLGNIGKSGPVI